MEGIIQENIVADVIQYKDKKYGEEPPKVPLRGSKYYFCHLVFFLLGICHFLPITFFSAANNFWMHKFRNASDTSDSASNRTFLQKNFASATMVANTLPSLIFCILLLTHGNRFKHMTRVITTLGVQLAIFIFFIISVRADTDDFQVMFFAFVLVAYGTLAGANTINIVTTMNLFSRFPHEITKTCLAGEGTAGVVGDIVNILSVYIYSNSLLSATLLYFICGACVVTVTFTLTLIISRTSFFNDCLDSVPQDVDAKLPSRDEVGRLYFKIRYILLLWFIYFIAYGATHTSVTALVVSEQDTTISSWAKNYFSPVMTFFLSDVAMLIGRVLGSFNLLQVSEKSLTAITVIRTLILVPFIWLCNAQPRDHLPILFPHDFEYGLIMAAFMITNGYIANLNILYISGKIEKEEADIMYTLHGLGVNIIQAVTAPIGLFVVNVL